MDEFPILRNVDVASIRGSALFSHAMIFGFESMEFVFLFCAQTCCWNACPYEVPINRVVLFFFTLFFVASLMLAGMYRRAS